MSNRFRRFGQRGNLVKTLRRWFVAIAAIGCLTMAMITPPFQAADEYLHFYRAYQISTGQLIPTRQTGSCSGYSQDFENTLCLGGTLPRSLLTTVRNASAQDLRFQADRKQDFASLRRLWSIPLQPDDRQFLKFNTTGLHAPIGYLPQAIGIAIGRGLGALPGIELPPIALMYLGRLSNAIVWMGSVWLAMAIAPEFTLAWFAIGLLPMALFQAASLSADVLTNGLSCLIMALVLRYRSRPWESILMPGLLSSLMALFAVSKLAYAPMGLVLLLIPTRSFKSICTRFNVLIVRWLWFGLTGGLAIALVFGWSRIVDRIYVSLHPELDPTAQIAGILADPLGFVAIALTTLATNAGHYLHQLIGIFGWIDTPLPQWLVVGYAIALLLSFIFARSVGDVRKQGQSYWHDSRRDSGRDSWSQLDRLIASAAFVSSIGLLCVLAYLWNIVGADQIGGIQGRYFIPLLPLLLPILSRSRRALNRQIWLTGIINLAILSVIASSWTLAQRYYYLPWLN